jgi:hypothetical protein
MKRSLYFWALLPLIYAIVGIALDALLFNQWTIDTSAFRILRTSMIGLVDLFQCIVIFASIGVAYVLAGSSRVQNWNLLGRMLPFLPFVGILVAIAMTVALWFLALPVAILSACLTWWNMNVQQRRG